MSNDSSYSANEPGFDTAKSWVRSGGEMEKAPKRLEGVALKHTKNTYINAQMTYWGGTFEEPRGAKLRLIKMPPQEGPNWDFDNPEQCIDLDKSEIEKLRSFLGEEFRRGGLGNTFWIPVSDPTLAAELSPFFSEGRDETTDLTTLIAALSLNSDLVDSILESDQAELAIQLRERARRVTVLDDLEQLIDAEGTPEDRFQELLEENPWVFGGEVVRAAELRTIGTADQVDIPIVRGDGSMVVVELKRASASSIARYDHGYPVLNGNVHLAVQQAQRYLYELDRNADTLFVKHGFDSRRATSLVVIGVLPDLENEDTDKFLESFRIYNSHLARIQVITYDHLLQNARRLVELRTPEGV